MPKEKASYRKPREKKYRGMDIDVRLDRDVLDELNRIRKIKVIGVCSGHTHPTEYGQVYYGDVPELVFHPSNGPEKVCEHMRAMRDTKKANFRCYPDEAKDMVTIRGTKKGTKAWWDEITSIAKKL